MRGQLLVWGGLVGTLGLLAATEEQARACGGCFHPPPGPNETPSVITDHRMILSTSQTKTTLYDQIEYQGNPSSFAWVLPIAGSAVADVGLSADVVFATLDSLTKVTIHSPVLECPGPPSSNCPGDNAGFGGASFADAGAAPPVTVVKQQTVGPYETVQLKADDPTALINWLTSHSYVIPDDVKPIITAYTNEHFGFLALKLVPGASVKAMRPVRVSTPGSSPVLPLRMVAAGTGQTVGITLWVIGEGRYETQNFPSFTIAASELTWDWAPERSNYTTLRDQKNQALGGNAWLIESSQALAPSLVDQRITSGGTPYGGPSDPSVDYDPQPVDGGAGKTAAQVRQEDLDTLFNGMNPASVRITRMRSDLARGALSKDLTLSASVDQSAVPTDLQVTQSVNTPACPTYPPPSPCQPDPIFGDAGRGGPILPPNDGASSNGKESFSCASTARGTGGGTDGGGGGFAAAIAIAGLVGTSLARRRRSARGARKSG